VGEKVDSTKKPRRSERLSQGTTTPVTKKKQLPSPLTAQDSISSNEVYKEHTATPPEGRPSQINHRTPERSPSQRPGVSSPPQDTQPFSQFVFPNQDISDEVQDEEEEGVWGYLLPLDAKYGKSLVLRKRSACPLSDAANDMGKAKSGKATKSGKSFRHEEEKYENTKVKGVASGGYLIGRHPECGMFHPSKQLTSCSHF
jgi:serine/threonine-protein kinase Chk2